MRKIALFAVLLWGSILFLAVRAALAVDLPRMTTLLDAERTPVILVPPSATPAESFAACELRTYLEKITGRRLAVTNDGDGAVLAPAIILGAHPLNDRLDWRKLGPDEFIIAAESNRLHIAGGRAPAVKDGAGAVHAQERGTLYGVYEFLESLGVRWYRPEPWGEHVPSLTNICAPLGQQTCRPGYQYRFGFTNYRCWRDETPEQGRQGKLWATRQRQNVNMYGGGPELGGYYEIHIGHSYMYRVPHEQWFATHPEYFALIDGKRSSDPGAQLCLGNPDVLRLISDAVIAEARSNPQVIAVSVEPNDGGLWCECDKCRAMDDPKLLDNAGGVSMANRVCAFNNQVARNLAAAVPGAGVNWYAYNRHTERPTLVKKLESNTLVWAAAYAGGYSDWSKNLDDPASMQNARFVKVLDGYRALTQLMIYEYFYGYEWFGPMPAAGMLTDRLRNYRRHGVVGVYTMGPGHWGPQGLVNYLAAKLMWNPDLDVAQELELYFKNYYGPAAAPMKQYHETMEQAAKGGPYFGSGGSFLQNFFTGELLARLGGPMQQARQLARGRQPYEQRLEGVWAGYEFARRLHEVYTLKAAADIPAAGKALKELEAFVLSYKNGDVFDNGPSSEPLGHLRDLSKDLLEQAEFMRQFINAQVVQDCSKQWRFQTDPQDKGIAAGWMRPDFDAGAWPLLDADRWWQEQGYPDYHGVAWYRRQFQPPDRKGARRTVLYFGAVDGDATVFVNGRKASERILPANAAGWDKPFYVDITDLLQPGQTNLMAVRVKDDIAMSGIFKGVRLLHADGFRSGPASNALPAASRSD